MALVWATCGVLIAAIIWYFVRHRPLRCYLCSKRIRGLDRKRALFDQRKAASRLRALRRP
jgi:hypothetical protein